MASKDKTPDPAAEAAKAAAAKRARETEAEAKVAAAKEEEAKAAAEAKARASGEASLGSRLKRGAKYTTGFVNGTFENTFGSMGSWGRKGMWVGGGLGILAAISGAGLIMPFMGMAAGLVAGAIAGGAFGAVTGGVKNINRMKRIEDNADQVEARARVATVREQATRSGPDFRERYREQQRRQNYTTDRVIQQERELKEDTFVDRVTSQGNHHSRGF